MPAPDILNDTAAMLAADPREMHRRIREFPDECANALSLTDVDTLPDALRDLQQIIIFGMGGSAIGGDLLRALTERAAHVPIIVSREYHAPAWVGPETLAIGLSYSGGTEETLCGMAEALERGARGLAITTGGEMARLVTDAGGVVLPVRYASQPRAALAHLFLPLLKIVEALGYVPRGTADAAAAIESLKQLAAVAAPEAEWARNPAKQLAFWIGDGVPLVLTAQHLSPVGFRWKCQVSENGKSWALFEPLSEMNHNTVVGLVHPQPVARALRGILLDSALHDARIRRRGRVTMELLDDAGIPNQRITAPGESLLGDQLWLTHLGDWMSYYMAMLRGADPTPVVPIDRLKAALAAGG